MLFENLVRPTMYRLAKSDPELVHERTISVLAKLGTTPLALAALRQYYAVDAPTTVFGLRFPGPVGLAAGMDKDGQALAAWPALGFGFVELGTVTGLAQPGNPKPRLFHLPETGAVINRMGFNNAGADALAARLARHGTLDVPVGISIGKSKATPLAEAVADYQSSLRTLYPYADYFAVNVSSPNTAGLRALQDRDTLTELLKTLQQTSSALADAAGTAPTPLLVKVSPDLSFDALDELLDVCSEHRVAGLIATNTTVSRSGLAGTEAHLGKEVGGLSGAPLASRARDLVRHIRQRTEGSVPIIGVGGIGGPHDAERMLEAGASLVQVYTGFALSGPALIRRINRALAQR